MELHITFCFLAKPVKVCLFSGYRILYRLIFAIGMTKVFLKLLCSYRFAKNISLNIIRILPIKDGKLLHRLDSLQTDTHIEHMRNTDDLLQKHEIRFILQRFTDKGPIQLDNINMIIL